VTGVHHHWGLAPYDGVHRLQARLVAARAEGRIPNVLLTGEHPPVVTLGRRTPAGVTTPPGVPVVAVERGGEATWHGPGQLVAYPIVHLTEARRDLHRYQRDLEEVGIRTLVDLGLAAERREGLAGVWVGGRKVMSLGIAVRRWVAWHGLALNLSADTAAFRAFYPCGLDGVVMASVAELLGEAPSIDRALRILVAHAGDLLPGGPFLPGPLPFPLESTDPPPEVPAAPPGLS
jgi:lipoyl(octanoyl) transferase